MGTFGINLNTSGFGLGTGINVQTTVATIIQADEAPEQPMLNEQTFLQSQSSAISNISSLLTTLQTSVQALQDPQGQLTSQVANSSNTAVLTATTTGGATLENHTITVGTLASTSSVYTTSLTNGNTTFSGGQIQLQVGSNSPVTIPVDSTTHNDNTLNSLASYINKNSQTLGVTANVITDAGGARLSIVSNTTGQPGNITVVSNTTGLNFNNATTGLPNAIAGVNASLSVDGVPVSSASNTVTGAIPGVTLNLVGTSSTAVTLGIAPDTTQATSAVNNFVSAYNAVVQAINTQFSYTAGASSQPPLFADSGLQQVQQTLNTDINTALTGNNGITNLESIGVSLQDDGTLQVNSATLSSALTNNFSAVQNLFQQTTGQKGFAVQLNSDLTNLTNTISGPLAIDLQGVNSSLTAVANEINDFQANITTQQQQLTTQFSQVNATLQQLPLIIEQIDSELGLSTGGTTGA
ncbi:MAG TPA: flagellar filament capping protein FliD [Terriglobia bacterium]|nr:flagellar filament capping protein FliD [Terriglobia bacterium]